MDKNKQIPKLVKEFINEYNENDDIDDKKTNLAVIRNLMNENLKAMRKD